jgi:hypothetical protein
MLSFPFLTDNYHTNIFQNYQPQSQQQMNEIEELIKGLRKCPRFKAYLILNNDGIVIKWDQEGKPMPYPKAVQYAHHVMDVFSKSKTFMKELFDVSVVSNKQVVDFKQYINSTYFLNAQDNNIESIRIRSDDYELIASQEGHYTLVVIQDGSWVDGVKTGGEEVVEPSA